MKTKLSKSEAKEKINGFFRQTEELDSKYVKKIKRLSMRHNIKLGGYRKRFCKKCYSDLKIGKVRVTKTHKTVECPECGFGNQWRIDSS